MTAARWMVEVLRASADGHGIVTSEVACSATAFLVWDTLINLDKEMEYIWSGHNGWVNWTYFFIRHMPYLAQGSILTLVATADRSWGTTQCRAWITYQLAVAEALTIAVEIVLIVRICAMFNRNRLVVGAVFVLFAGEVAAMCAVLVIAIPRMEFTHQCLITSTPKLFPSYWAIALTFETVLFGLTIVKFFRFLSIGQVRRQSIMITLMRDGTWAYAVIFVIMLLNTMMYELENDTLAGVCYFWELSVMSFAGSHLLINLRQLAKDPRAAGSCFTPSYGDSEELDTFPYGAPLSDLRFAHGDPTDLTVIELQTLRH